MTTAKEFLESLPWTIDVLWQGKSGVALVDDDRRATITLHDPARVDEFSGCNVEITSKTIGTITKKWFAFDDHLTDRTDLRTDYPLGSNICFYVWGTRDRDWRWYIAIPAHPEQFTQAIEGWIDTWR